MRIPWHPVTASAATEALEKNERTPILRGRRGRIESLRVGGDLPIESTNERQGASE